MLELEPPGGLSTRAWLASAPFCGGDALMVRWIISGGGSCFRARPITAPTHNRAVVARADCSHLRLPKNGAQALQKLPLVQTCQRNRKILSPHSAQKFG